MKQLAVLFLSVLAVGIFLPTNSAEARMCFRCDGKGYIEEYVPAERNHYTGEQMRPGYTKRTPCPSCGGSGYKD